MIDITELSAEDRQKALWEMPIGDLNDTILKLLDTNPVAFNAARVDALTIYSLRASNQLTTKRARTG